MTEDYHNRESPSALEGSVTWYFGQFRRGNNDALEPLWERFFPRLQGLAREILARHPIRAAGADDAVQEALVSFWQRVRGGQFADVLHRDHLWNLLALFTAYKTKRLVRQESAKKRGGGQLQHIDHHETEAGLNDLAWEAPAELVDLYVAELLEGLPEELREFATLRLIGHTTEEIAELMKCTQRKVQRKLELVRLNWLRHLPQD
ncbi:MAG TPA: ECF-type sigma factor [Planctomycetaceae bacterium]|nr:ECF-type sigma factor [Planctomycetaceae bacterium]